MKTLLQKNLLKSASIAAITVFVMIFQLMNPVMVLADDATPPLSTETPTVVEQQPATEQGTESATPETTIVETPSPTDVSTSNPTVTEVATDTATPPATEQTTESATTETEVVETPSPTDVSTPSPVAVTESVAASEDTTPLVSQLPNDTQIVVTDPNGIVLPLATNDAAEVILLSDPIWCPDGVPPIANVGGCTNSYATMSGLLAFEGSYIDSQTTGGTIWITSGTVGDVSNILIDGTTYTNWANYSLTLQGGWSGISGSTSTGSNSIFSVPIIIQNWYNDVTVSKITTSKSVKVDYSNSNVTINNVSAGEEVTVAGDANTGNVTIDHVNTKGLSIWSYTYGNTILIKDSNISGNTTSWTAGYIDAWYNSLIIQNSHFDNNMGNGLTLYNGWGDNGITFTNSTFNHNGGTGAAIAYAVNHLVINGGQFNFNNIGLSLKACYNGVELNDPQIIGNKQPLPDAYLDCIYTGHIITTPPIVSETRSISAQSTAVIALNCSRFNDFTVILPNGDKVQIFCPVGGLARIARLDNTTLPADLPDGYTYASAFSMQIYQNNEPVSILSGGGHIKAAFIRSPLQAGKTYSILYWADGTWIPLKDFMVDESGYPHVFDLNPEGLKNQQEILSGVDIITKKDFPYVEVTTNFPGVFVLAQH